MTRSRPDLPRGRQPTCRDCPPPPRSDQSLRSAGSHLRPGRAGGACVHRGNKLAPVDVIPWPMSPIAAQPLPIAASPDQREGPLPTGGPPLRCNQLVRRAHLMATVPADRPTRWLRSSLRWPADSSHPHRIRPGNRPVVGSERVCGLALAQPDIPAWNAAGCRCCCERERKSI
jgi:hypothetical protein